MESANIRRPQVDPRHGHVLRNKYLLRKGRPVRKNVARPHSAAHCRAPNPRAPRQREAISHAMCGEALEERALVLPRVRHSHLRVLPREKGHLAGHRALRLARVQPINLDAVRKVARLHRPPLERARGGVRGVHKVAR